MSEDVSAIEFFYSFIVRGTLQMGFQDVAFMCSRASFYSIFLTNCGRS